MNDIDKLKIELRETASPFFSDTELQYYLEKNHNDLNSTIYECALLKAEDDSIALPGGLNIPNNRDYWLRLAARYRPNTSGVR
ncbi:MAG: hypothetical protein ACRCR2_03710 [Fusobacteriaceae bacterium]